MKQRPEMPGTVALPRGVDTSEGLLLLDLLARLKERRFGRLTVTVSDSRVVAAEILEKIDRALLVAASGGEH